MVDRVTQIGVEGLRRTHCLTLYVRSGFRGGLKSDVSPMKENPAFSATRSEATLPSIVARLTDATGACQPF